MLHTQRGQIFAARADGGGGIAAAVHDGASAHLAGAKHLSDAGGGAAGAVGDAGKALAVPGVGAYTGADIGRSAELRLWLEGRIAGDLALCGAGQPCRDSCGDDRVLLVLGKQLKDSDNTVWLHDSHTRRGCGECTGTTVASLAGHGSARNTADAMEMSVALENAGVVGLWHLSGTFGYIMVIRNRNVTTKKKKQDGKEIYAVWMIVEK